jgi:hypothetical protein
VKTTTFRKGDRVQLNELARARGFGSGAKLGTVCRSPNPTAMSVRVVWDTHGSRSGLYCSREFLRKVNPGTAANNGPTLEA